MTDLPENLRELARCLEAGYIDGLLRTTLGFSQPALRSAIAELVKTGWLDGLSEAQRSKLKSYQLKRLLQRKPSSAEQKPSSAAIYSPEDRIFLRA